MSQETFELEAFLAQLPAGDVPAEAYPRLQELLMLCWYAIQGTEQGGMEPRKLKRVEALRWEPPVLSFTIERHGATVMGSSRAALQRWSLNIKQMTADCNESSYRQIYARNPPLNVGPIAQEVADHILGRKEHPAVTWRRDGAVRVTASKLLGGGSIPKETLDGRRKNFWKALVSLLEPYGWTRSGAGVFVRTQARKEQQDD